MLNIFVNRDKKMENVWNGLLKGNRGTSKVNGYNY